MWSIDSAVRSDSIGWHSWIATRHIRGCGILLLMLCPDGYGGGCKRSGGVTKGSVSRSLGCAGVVGSRELLGLSQSCALWCIECSVRLCVNERLD